MFQAACGDREFERLLSVLVGIQTVYQRGSETVATAYPINDADGDGVCGDGDNCPADSNASQAHSRKSRCW